MTPEQIKEYDNIIAIFDGAHINIINGVKIYYFENPKFSERHGDSNLFDYYHKIYESELNYRLDWNWIIPVCEHIEKTYDEFHGYFGVHIHSNGCTIQGTKLRTNPENFHPAYFNEVYADTKLEATYLAVVSFIQFYNQQLKNESN